MTVGFGDIVCVEGLQEGVNFVRKASGMEGIEVKAEIIQDKLQSYLNGVGQWLNSWCLAKYEVGGVDLTWLFKLGSEMKGNE